MLQHYLEQNMDACTYNSCIGGATKLLKEFTGTLRREVKYGVNSKIDILLEENNHKTYIDRAREEIERGRRFQHRLVFLIFDLDKEDPNLCLKYIYGGKESDPIYLPKSSFDVSGNSKNPIL